MENWGIAMLVVVVGAGIGSIWVVIMALLAKLEGMEKQLEKKKAEEKELVEKKEEPKEEKRSIEGDMKFGTTGVCLPGSSMESQDLVMMSTPLITPERPDESVAAVPEKGILKKVKVVAPSPSPSQKKKEQQKQTAKGGQEQKGNAKGKGKVVQETKKQQTGKEKTGEEKGKGKEQTEEKEAEDKDASLTPSRTRHRSRSHNPSPSPSTPVVQEEWEVVGQPQVQAVKAKVNEMEKELSRRKETEKQNEDTIASLNSKVSSQQTTITLLENRLTHLLANPPASAPSPARPSPASPDHPAPNSPIVSKKGWGKGKERELDEEGKWLKEATLKSKSLHGSLYSRLEKMDELVEKLSEKEKKRD